MFIQSLFMFMSINGRPPPEHLFLSPFPRMIMIIIVTMMAMTMIRLHLYLSGIKIFTTILLIRFLFFISLQVLSLVIHESLGQNFYKTFLHPARALTLTQQYRQM
jgi:hypothetical protein